MSILRQTTPSQACGAQNASCVAAGRRKNKPRYPFDIYEDQVEELKRQSLEDRMQGGLGSMSAMVREAIDDYTAKVRA